MNNTITITSLLGQLVPFYLLFRVKKTVFLAIVLMYSYVGFAQTSQEEVSVEKSLFGVQLGFSGLGAYHELKLTNQIALHSEIAFVDIGTNTQGEESYFTELMFSLEPRWYYNLQKRANKDKRIDGNRGNYLSLRASYFLFDVTEVGKRNYNLPLLAATWGFSRNIGNNFNYDVGVGGGLGFNNDVTPEVAFSVYFNLRIGYRF